MHRHVPFGGTHYDYDVDVWDYNLWIQEKMPVIFILFDASRRRAYSLAVQQYFRTGGVCI
jgi:hypothetical protein